MTQFNLTKLSGLVGGHWSGEQIALIADQVAPKASPPELALFLHVAKARGLDPFAKQIYAIHRKQKVDGVYVQKMAIQVSIDGYRLIADRTGEYVGSDEPVFVERDGKPVKATVTVWRRKHGERCAFTASARMSEYCQERSPMWGRMPFLMLAKCAEGLALRKAFPEALSGIYTDAEMDQAGDGDVVHAEVVNTELTAPVQERMDRERSAMDEIEELLAGPCADLEDAVREDLASGTHPGKCLHGLKVYMAGIEKRGEGVPAGQRATQSPADDF